MGKCEYFYIINVQIGHFPFKIETFHLKFRHFPIKIDDFIMKNGKFSPKILKNGPFHLKFPHFPIKIVDFTIKNGIFCPKKPPTSPSFPRLLISWSGFTTSRSVSSHGCTAARSALKNAFSTQFQPFKRRFWEKMADFA
jgi:hypothetical protein